MSSFLWARVGSPDRLSQKEASLWIRPFGSTQREDKHMCLSDILPQVEQLLLSCSVMSDSLSPRGRQHNRLLCPVLSPRACSNSYPSSQGCHPTISSSVMAFSSCPPSFLASRSFPKNGLFASGGPSTGASASVLPMNIQSWLPLGLTDLISVQSKGLSRLFSSTTFRKHQLFATQPSLWSNTHIHTWLLEKP